MELSILENEVTVITDDGVPHIHVDNIRIWAISKQIGECFKWSSLVERHQVR